MDRSPGHQCLTHVTLMVCLLVAAHTRGAQMQLGEICRVKGQETNTLQGLGLVVGLRGTGDSDAAPTARALARMMQLMGGPLAASPTGQLNLDDVADAKNVAMVFVTATVPAVGAQSGDLLDVTVNAISAKSLQGGTLMLTPLLGPRTDSSTVYAMAQGQLNVSAEGPPTSAKIQGGAKMEASVPAQYLKDGKITLVLEKNFASFNTAQQIEDHIRDLSSLVFGASASEQVQANAIDQLHVEVVLPELYRQAPIKFISLLLTGVTIQVESHSSRVVINESDGIVVIGKDVEIAPGLITHRNLRIEAGGSGGFVPISNQDDESVNAKLKSLADALNALDVPTEDLIAIIKTLKSKGDLYGEVIFQ